MTQGCASCLVVVGYRADAVQDFFGDGSRYKIAIQYATQTVQDGTGRVVDLARDFVGDRPFILSYGDILVDPANYKRVVDLPEDVEAIVSVTRGEDVSKGGAVFRERANGASRSSGKSKTRRIRPVPGITPGSTPFGQAFLNSRRN